MKKQTAVDFLWTKASSGEHLTPEDFEQAKAIEREQIIEAWNGGNYGYFYSKGNKEDFNDGSEYYNEVYKGGKK